MGKRAWLEKEITNELLPALRKLEPTILGIERVKALNDSLRSSWVARGFEQVRQQQSLMDTIRRSIKDHLGENHFSLDYIGFTKEEYIELNDLKQGRVQERNEEVKYLDDPDAIVNKAVELLSSPEWSEVAAGLAVVTGRRSSEILSTAKFSRCSDWSVTFTGALKRGSETQILSFEIPTLAKSDDVIKALSYVRTALPDAATMAASTVNSKYGPSVIGKCDRHFEGLVPLRTGSDNLYTHLFRAVYATIATFWYCPPSVNDVEFKAAIQGHYQILDESNSERRRSLAASRHYSDYEIADAVIAQYNGKRKGIKLNCPGVTIIEPFKELASPQTKPVQPKKHFSTIRVLSEDKQKLEEIFTLLGLDKKGTQAERFDQFLNWAVNILAATSKNETDETEQLSDSTVESGSTDDVEEEVINETVLQEIQPLLDNTYSEVSNSLNSSNATPTSTPTPITQRDLIENNTVDEGLRPIRALEDSQPIYKDETVNPIPTKNDSTASLLSSQPVLTGLESKLDKLIDVMTLFISSSLPSSVPQQQPPFPQDKTSTTSESTAKPTEPKSKPPSDKKADSSKTITRKRNNPQAQIAINKAIDAIIAHNNTQGLLHDLKWAITINAVKELVSEVTKSQRLVQQVIKGRSAEIDAHHTTHSLDPIKHNHRHKHKHKITEVISPINAQSVDAQPEFRSNINIEPHRDTFTDLAAQFLNSDDPWRKLTGLIALTGEMPDNLLKIFVFKGVENEHTILYTLQVHPIDTPYLKLITLVDAALVTEAITILKTHPELKPYLDTHVGKDINAYARERIADYLGQLGVEHYSDAIAQYKQIVADSDII